MSFVNPIQLDSNDLRRESSLLESRKKQKQEQRLPGMRAEYWRNVYADASNIGAFFTHPVLADEVARILRPSFGPRSYRLHIKVKEPMVGK